MSKTSLKNIGKVLIEIITIAVKARMGLYKKNPLGAIADIKVLVDGVVDTTEPVKTETKEE